MISKHFKFGIVEVVLLITLQSSVEPINDTIIPGPEWEQYKTPEAAGWSSAKLAKAKAIAEKVGSASVLIIYKGAVVQSWGDASRRFCMHSARKATLSALLGIYIDKKLIDPKSTLADLGIDEVTPLTSIEKRATVMDLLTCYSGIYLPSVIGGSQMPPRGAHAPGEKWYYNNWNFNALNTIFEQQTKTGLTDAFMSNIALPIGMEDFRKNDAFYIREKISLHPGYHINLSSRDFARFGLMYLNDGRWNDQQIVPEQWVKESIVSHAPKKEKYGFGYAWWINDKMDMYSAEGWGGHALMVFPKDDIIIVHRANTYIPKTVDWEQFKPMVKAIMAARTERKELDPSTLISFKIESHKPNMYVADPAKTAKYERYYDNDGDPVTIKRVDGRLIVNIPYQGNFDLYALTDSTFFVNDKEEVIRFTYDKSGVPLKALFDQ